MVAVKSIIKSKRYNESSGANDVGVLILSTPLEFTDSVKSIALPDPRQRSYNVGPVHFSGQGRNSTVKVIKSKIYSFKECSKKFNTTTLTKDKGCAAVNASSKCEVSYQVLNIYIYILKRDSIIDNARRSISTRWAFSWSCNI